MVKSYNNEYIFSYDTVTAHSTEFIIYFDFCLVHSAWCPTASIYICIISLCRILLLIVLLNYVWWWCLLCRRLILNIISLNTLDIKLVLEHIFLLAIQHGFISLLKGYNFTPEIMLIRVLTLATAHGYSYFFLNF